jgi:hypothetical protein
MHILLRREFGDLFLDLRGKNLPLVLWRNVRCWRIFRDSTINFVAIGTTFSDLFCTSWSRVITTCRLSRIFFAPIPMNLYVNSNQLWAYFIATGQANVSYEATDSTIVMAHAVFWFNGYIISTPHNLAKW